MSSAVVGYLRAILTLDSAQFESGTRKSADAAKAFSKDLDAIGKQATKVGEALTKTVTVPLLGLGAGVAKLAMDFESSFAGIRKTVDEATDEFGNLTKVGEGLVAGMRQLSKEIPVNVNELNRLGEAAGALNIPTDKIVDFAEVMAKLGVTTNVTSDQAAESIAKIQTVFKAAGQETENFASALVYLGNNGSSTEAQILELANRIASAGRAVGMTQAEVLGFSSAIANVGIEAEAGGTAISKVFSDLSIAVSKGGTDLANFAKVAGMSSAEFQKAFKQDAAGAVTAFIEGIGRANAAGADLNLLLEDLGFKEVRQARALRDLALSGDNLANSLRDGSQAWRENTALSKESEQAFKTTANQLTLLWNRIKDVGITFGNALLPAIQGTIRLLDGLVPVLERGAKAFAALPTPVQMAAVGLGTLAAAAGPAIWLMGQMATSVAALTAAFAKKGIATAAAAQAVSGFATYLPTLNRGLVALSAQFALTSGSVEAFKLTLMGLGVAAGVAASALVGWGIGRLIAEATGADEAFERWGYQLQGFSEEEARAGVATRKLGDEIRKLNEDVSKSLDALAAKDMAAFANATEAARRKAVELASDLPKAELKLQGLADAARRLGNEGKLTPSVMAEIGREATALSAAGRKLPDILQAIVDSQKGVTTVQKEGTKEALVLTAATEKLTGAKKKLKEAVDGLRASQVPLTEIQKAAVNGLLKLGQSHEEIARLLGVHVQQIDLYVANTELATERTAALTDEWREMQALLAKPPNFEWMGDLPALLEKENRIGLIPPLTVPVRFVPGGFGKGGFSTQDLPDALQQENLFGPARPSWMADTKSWRTQLDNLGASFTQLAQVAGDSLGSITRELGVFIASVGMAAAGSEDFGEGLAKAQDGERTKGFLQMAAGIMSVGAAFLQATASGGAFSKTVKGALFGAQVGAELGGPLGAAIGAGIGGAAGLVRAIFGGPSQRELEGRKAAGDFRAGLLQGLSESQMAEVRTAAAGAWRGNEAGAATVIALRDAYLRMGRSASDAQALAEAGSRRLVAAEKQGADAVREVQKEFEVLFAQVEQSHANAEQFAADFPALLEGISASGAVATQQFKDLLAELEKTGEFTAEINGFITGQTSRAVEGLTGFLQTATTGYDTLTEQEKTLAGLLEQRGENGLDYEEKRAALLKQIDELGKKEKRDDDEDDRLAALRKDLAKLDADFQKAGNSIEEQIAKARKGIADATTLIAATQIATQAGADAMGAALFASFSELQKRGVSVGDALKAVMPGVQALEKQLEKTGFKGSAAFQQLSAMAKVASDTVTGPTLTSIHGLSDALVGLSNAGLLNQEMFVGLTNQITASYNAMQLQGVDGSAALRLIAPDLQKIWQLQQDFGYEVDGATQNLINQGIEAGLVGQQHRSANEKIALSLQSLVELFKDFLAQLDSSKQKADATKASVEGIGTATANLPDGDFTITERRQVINETSEQPTIEDIANMPPPPGYRWGGDGWVPDEYHRGGFVTAHQGMYLGGLKAGEVMVKALTGEGVLNRGATADLGGKAGIDAANAGNWDAVWNGMGALASGTTVAPALGGSDLLGLAARAGMDTSRMEAGIAAVSERVDNLTRTMSRMFRSLPDDLAAAGYARG